MPRTPTPRCCWQRSTRSRRRSSRSMTPATWPSTSAAATEPAPRRWCTRSCACGGPWTPTGSRLWASCATGRAQWRCTSSTSPITGAGIETGPDGDFVLGRGLRILEAMASGRAAYVYGEEGGDGWVTPARYELLEADGFSGRAEASATDFERLRRDLEAYDPAMGFSNRELALAHSARDHAQELVRIFDALASRRDPVDAPLRELARLVRIEAATARRADAAAAEAHGAGTRVRKLERELAEARERNEQLTERVAVLEQALREAEKREAAA